MQKNELAVKVTLVAREWHASIGTSPHVITGTGATPVKALKELTRELEGLALVSVWHMDVDTAVGGMRTDG